MGDVSRLGRRRKRATEAQGIDEFAFGRVPEQMHLVVDLEGRRDHHPLGAGQAVAAAGAADFQEGSLVAMRTRSR